MKRRARNTYGAGTIAADDIERADQVRSQLPNRLLALLAEGELRQLVPNMELVALEPESVLFEASAPIIDSPCPCSVHSLSYAATWLRS